VISQKKNHNNIYIKVHLVLHPHGIAPTFLKLDSWADFSPNTYIHQGNKSDKERKVVRKELSLMHTKIFNTFLRRWVPFRVGAIPRLPTLILLLLEDQLYNQYS
jgi:hypothetical protein